MINKIQCLLLILFLVGCVHEEQKETIKPTTNKKTVTIDWYPTEDIDKTCREKSHTTTTKLIRGCAHPDKDKCIIYSPMPKTVDDEATMTFGHEALLHCFLEHHHEKD